MAALTVPTIFTAVDKLSSVVSKMQGNVSKFASETEKKYANMSRKAQQWQTNFSQVGMAAGIAGAAIVAPLGLAVKQAMDFEDQMANVGTVVDVTKENMVAMGKQVLDVFTKVPVKLDDLAESLYHIRSAGIPAAEAMDTLTQAAKLSVIGRGSVVEATKMMTSSMNIFRDEGLSATQIMAGLAETVRSGDTKISEMSESFGANAPLLHRMGMSFRDMRTSIAAMTSVAMPASQVLTHITSSVMAMNRQSKGMHYVMAKLGVRTSGEAIKKFGNLGNAMQAIEDKAKALHVIIPKMWGKINAQKGVVLLTGGVVKERYQGMMNGPDTSMADAVQAYAVKMETLKMQAQLLQNQFQELGIKIGGALLPSLKTLAQFLIPIIKGFAQWVEDNPGIAGGIIKTTAVVGALLVVLSPIAFILSGIAGMWKIYAGVQLLATQRTIAAAAAITTENAAVSGLATTFTTAETAATGFLGVLSGWVMPAAIVALIAWKGFKAIKEATSHNGHNMWDDFGPHKSEGEKWHDRIVAQQKLLQTDSAATALGFRPVHPDQMGTKKEPLKVLPTTSQKIDELFQQEQAIKGTINVNINDPGKHVESANSNGNISIPTNVNQKSTGPLPMPTFNY